MLTLVHPKPKVQETRKPKGTRTQVLTDFEMARARASLRNLRSFFGSWRKLADAMGITHECLERVANGRRNVTPDIVLRAARAAKKPVERLLGELASADVCPTCGKSSAA